MFRWRTDVIACPPSPVASKKQEEETIKYFSAVDGLKKLYKSKVLPVEEMFKFDSLHSAALT